MKAAKISLIGLPAVGKTTMTKLIRGQQINGRYNPTMGFNLGKKAIDGVAFNIWDFGGQKAFLKQQLSKYIYGSDILFIVTDSTPKNVLSTKEILEHSKRIVEDDCEIVVIANKQDLKGHMTSDRIENVLQTPTFPMVAIDAQNRQTMVELIQTLMGYVKNKKTMEN